jgi:hypothetical protein
LTFRQRNLWHWWSLNTLNGGYLYTWTKGDTVWKDLIEVKVDPEKIEHLFETRMSEVKQKVSIVYDTIQFTICTKGR